MKNVSLTTLIPGSQDIRRMSSYSYPWESLKAADHSREDKKVTNFASNANDMSEKIFRSGLIAGRENNVSIIFGNPEIIVTPPSEIEKGIA